MMTGNKVIAVIGLPVLVGVGLRSIMQEAQDISVRSYVDFDEFRHFDESADGYVVSAEVFSGNLDYFMPRRSKTLLYGSFQGLAESDSIRYIHVDDDETIVGERLASLLDSLAAESDKGELSSREKDVLRLLVAGKINKEIADDLCISINTVITHRKNISLKTGIKSVSGLSIYALMNGIT